MATETLEYIATAADGDALPRLAGLESDRPIEVVRVVRTADQIRITVRHELGDLRDPRAAARALAARAPHPVRT